MKCKPTLYFIAYLVFMSKTNNINSVHTYILVYIHIILSFADFEFFLYVICHPNLVWLLMKVLKTYLIEFLFFRPINTRKLNFFYDFLNPVCDLCFVKLRNSIKIVKDANLFCLHQLTSCSLVNYDSHLKPVARTRVVLNSCWY